MVKSLSSTEISAAVLAVLFAALVWFTKRLISDFDSKHNKFAKTLKEVSEDNRFHMKTTLERLEAYKKEIDTHSQNALSDQRKILAQFSDMSDTITDHKEDLNKTLELTINKLGEASNKLDSLNVSLESSESIAKDNRFALDKIDTSVIRLVSDNRTVTKMLLKTGEYMQDNRRLIKTIEEKLNERLQKREKLNDKIRVKKKAS